MLAQLVIIQLALKGAMTSSPGSQTSLEVCAFLKHALDAPGTGILFDGLFLLIPSGAGRGGAVPLTSSPACWDGEQVLVMGRG